VEGKLADLAPVLLDFTFDPNEVAFAQVFGDGGSQRPIARDAQDPSNARRLAIAAQYRRDR
jgi:hypothetical protein